LYLDSSATRYVTSDLNNLSNFIPYDDHDILNIDNDIDMQILHIDSSSFRLTTHSIFLQDILHVPSFTKKLLNLSKLLLDNSLLIEFFFNICLIKDRLTSTPLFQTELYKGLYSVHLPHSPPPQAFLDKRVSANVWHARLGLLSSSTTLYVLNS
jgi:hypothetical protein